MTFRLIDFIYRANKLPPKQQVVPIHHIYQVRDDSSLYSGDDEDEDTTHCFETIVAKNENTVNVYRQPIFYLQLYNEKAQLENFYDKK